MMKKMTKFKKRKKDKIDVDAFNTNKFIKEFASILDNKNLTDKQKTKMLYNHCLYDKNSPLKINKG